MTILTILQYPDFRLKRIGKKVSDVNDPRIQNIIKEMFETLDNAKSCAALAATQLDIEDPPAITVINRTEGYLEPFCLINPEIIASEGESLETEGCMSVEPDRVYAVVKRAAKITATALTPEGKELKIEADGFLARCIQHEVDHLNGMIYLDRLSRLKRSRVEKKLFR